MFRHLLYEPKKTYPQPACQGLQDSRSTCRLSADLCKAPCGVVWYISNVVVPIHQFQPVLHRASLDWEWDNRFPHDKCQPFVQIMISLQFPPNMIFRFFCNIPYRLSLPLDFKTFVTAPHHYSKMALFVYSRFHRNLKKVYFTSEIRIEGVFLYKLW